MRRHHRLFSLFILLQTVLMLGGTLASAQDSMKISGTVTDTAGEPIPGATIIVKESRVGIATDVNGRFTIRATVGQHLKISFVGMKTKVVLIENNAPLKIKLQEDVKLLDGVVVTGYQKIQSRVFTGSTASVKAKDVKIEGVGDISRMLEGRVAGLNIQNVTGTFGAAPRINIRGGASILGNVQPLWVIDGAVYEDIVSLTLDQLISGDAVTLISSAISGINASDIEDIQVLKDASATSYYGARALNGVIVITTKSGKRSTPLRVNFSMEQSIRPKPSYRSHDLLNSQETMSVYQEMENKGYFGIANTLFGRRSGIYYRYYDALRRIDPSTGDFALPNTPEAKRDFFKEREYANTDWFDHLFTLNPISIYTLSLSSGSENMSSYASIGYYRDGGWSITDKTDRLTANIKNSFYLSDGVKATISSQGSFRSQRSPGTFAQRKNTAVGSFQRDFDINPFNYALGTPRTLKPYSEKGEYEYYRNNWAPFNILNEYKNNYIDINVLDFKIQGDLEYKINTHLRTDLIFTARHAYTGSSHFVKEGSNVIGAFRANETPRVAAENIYLLHDPNNPLLQPSVAVPEGGLFNKTTTYLKSYQGRFSMDYNKSFGKHDLKAFGFAEIRYADRVTNPFKGYGIQYSKGNQVFGNAKIFEKLLNEREDYFSLLEQYSRGISFSGSLTYGYDGRYVLNTVFNYEGANAAGASSKVRWLPTWNIGAKWNVDQESFMRDAQEMVSTLALRASYGLTAKMNEQAINSTVIYQNQIIPRVRADKRENALNIRHLMNKDLTWEKMYEINFGIEAGFWSNRLSLTVDMYQRNSFDLIDLVRTSGIGGEYYKYANFGDMRTRGIEWALKSDNIKTQDFKWSTSVTLSLMDQKITRLRNTPNTFDMVAGMGRGNIVGFPKSSLFSFNYQGLNRRGLPTFDFGLYPIGSRPGVESFGANFSDARYSKSYLIYHGSIEPKYIGGLSNTLSYKAWELSFFVTMQAGNKIRLNPVFDPIFADLNVFSSSYYNRWLNPGDEYKTDEPTIPSKALTELLGAENIERAYNTFNYSQNRVADGSFVRMKNISLSYTLPESVSKKMNIHSGKLTVQAVNPFLIYADPKLKGQDPEYFRTGGVSLPTPTQYTLSLNLNL